MLSEFCCEEEVGVGLLVRAEEEGADGGFPESEAGGPPSASPQGLSSDHIWPRCVVEYAAGGRSIRVRIPSKQGGGKPGRKQAITDFTKRSKRALEHVVNSIDQRVIDRECLFFVTLTYPAEFVGPREAKGHLRAWFKRLDREWGRTPVIWKLEPQKRGAPHFHLLVFMQARCEVERLTEWCSRVWFEIVGTKDEDHLRWHRGELGNRPCVEKIRDWNGVGAYASKYMSKTIDGREWDNPGRWWGVHRRDMLPVQIVRAEVSQEVAKKVRRAVIRWYEHQQSGRYRLQNYSEEWAEGIGWVRRLHGPIYRHWLNRSKLEELGGCFDVRPYHRRWPRSRGGCSMFMAAETFERIIAWALKEVGEQAIDRETGEIFEGEVLCA